MLNKTNRNSILYILLIAASVVASGCTSSDDDSTSTVTDSDVPGIPLSGTPLIETVVTASEGGTFNSADGLLRIIVPAGALAEDATLTVNEVADTTLLPANFSSAGDAVDISLGGVALLGHIELNMSIDQAPIHPQLAELSQFEDDVWIATNANFFRSFDNTIVTLVGSEGVYQPIYRTLQTESSDAVARGEEIFLNETFNNEQFFGGVVGLHDVLNVLTPTQAVGVGVHVDVSRVPQDIVDVLLSDDFAAKQSALLTVTSHYASAATRQCGSGSKGRVR